MLISDAAILMLTEILNSHGFGGLPEKKLP
jgi:hypothetical protein